MRFNSLFDAKVNRDYRVVLVLIMILIAIFAKITQQFLPEKYFYDSQKILGIMNNSSFYYSDKTFDFTASFYNTINIFNLKSLLQWGIFLAVIFNSILIFQLTRNKIFTIFSWVFVSCIVFLQNVYVFNLSKEIIQIVIFYLILFIICQKRINKYVKYLIVISLFCLEAFFFRTYIYIVAIFLTILLLITSSKIFKKRNNPIFLFVLFIIVFTIAMLIMSYIYPDTFGYLLNLREKINNSYDAVTQINDIVDLNNPLITYVLNFIINVFRLMFPFELLTKGVLYIPFIIFQIMYTFIIIFAICKMNQMSFSIKLSTLILISFFLTSVLFEPDFGSFIRHETAISPLMIYVLYNLEIINSKESAMYGKSYCNNSYI